MGKNDILKPGRTLNIGSPDHLTQVQHKGSRVDIVDHFHLNRGKDIDPRHLVTSIGRDGLIKIKMG